MNYFIDIVKNQGTVHYHQFMEKGIQPGTSSINHDDLTHVRNWCTGVKPSIRERLYSDSKGKRLRKVEPIVSAAKHKEQRFETSDAKKLKTKENKETSKRHLESLHLERRTRRH